MKRWIDKIPGGMMLVPLLLGALLRTLFAHIFNDTNTIFRTSDLSKIASAGFAGILLGLSVVVVPGVVLVALDRVTGGSGLAGIAAVIVTAILTPIVTAWYSQKLAKRGAPDVESLAA
jgi:2-keto-3-deoxygluconate permease